LNDDAFKPPRFLSALAAGGNNRYLDAFVEENFLKIFFVAYDFSSIEEGTYNLWRISRKWNQMLSAGYGLSLEYGSGMLIPRGYFKTDGEILSAMTAAILETNPDVPCGIGISVRASEWPKDHEDRYIGLFSQAPKTDGDLAALYGGWAEKYPLVFIEEPFSAGNEALYGIIRNKKPVIIEGGRKQGRVSGLDAIVLEISRENREYDQALRAEEIRDAGFYLLCDLKDDGITEEEAVDLTVKMNSDLGFEFGLGNYANRYLELEMGGRCKKPEARSS